MTRTIDTLRKARALVERGWTQGTSARDLSGNGLPEYDSHAVCWCITGALTAIRASRHRTDQEREDELNARRALSTALIRQSANFIALTAWNDDPSRTKNEVLKLFDDTIERLEKQANV